MQHILFSKVCHPSTSVVTNLTLCAVYVLGKICEAVFKFFKVNFSTVDMSPFKSGMSLYSPNCDLMSQRKRMKLHLGHHFGARPAERVLFRSHCWVWLRVSGKRVDRKLELFPHLSRHRGLVMGSNLTMWVVVMLVMKLMRVAMWQT